MSLKKITLASALCLAFSAPAFAQVETLTTPELDTDATTQVETQTVIETDKTTTNIETDTMMDTMTKPSDAIVLDLPREDVAGSVETFTPDTDVETDMKDEMSADTEVELWTDGVETDTTSEEPESEGESESESGNELEKE